MGILDCLLHHTVNDIVVDPDRGLPLSGDIMLKMDKKQLCLPFEAAKGPAMASKVSTPEMAASQD